MSKEKLDYKHFSSILDRFYGPRDGYFKYASGELEKFAAENIALTYGEILPNSLANIIDKLDVEETDVFYDLGSGVGKVALQFLLTTPIQTAYGIEAFNPRHNIANNIYKLIQQEYPELFNKNLKLASINDNFLMHDLQDSTIIFTDSLCFTKQTMDELTKKFNKLKKLKYVISLTEMQLQYLRLQEKLKLTFSWSQGAPTTQVYIYN